MIGFNTNIGLLCRYPTRRVTSMCVLVHWYNIRHGWLDMAPKHLLPHGSNFRPQMACQGHFSHHPLDVNIDSWTSYHTSEVARMLPPLWIQCNIISNYIPDFFRQKRLHTTNLSITINSSTVSQNKFHQIPFCGPSNNPAATNLPANDGWWLTWKAVKGWNRPGRDLFENSHTTQENKRANEVLNKVFRLKMLTMSSC